MAETHDSVPVAAGGVSKKGRFTIDLDHSLPDLDTRSANAYAATFEKTGGLAFALLCHADSIPRQRAIKKLIGKDLDGGVTLLDAERVLIPSEGRFRYALIYKRPVGGDLTRVKRETMKALPKELAVNRFLKSAISVLKDLHVQDVTHRGEAPSSDPQGPARLRNARARMPHQPRWV